MDESSTATPDREREAIIFRVAPQFKAELAQRAKRHDRSMGAEVRQLLEAALAHEEPDEATA